MPRLSPGNRTRAAPVRGATLPVISAALAGVQVGPPLYIEVRRAPFFATLSRFGVRIIVEPLQLRSPKPMSSQIITTMFGLSPMILLIWLPLVIDSNDNSDYRIVISL